MVRVKSLLDMLTSTVAVLGLLPLYLFLELPAQLVVPPAIIAGAWFDRRGTFPFGSRAATVISVAVFLFYAVQVSRQNLVDPTLNIAVLLLAVRLLTEKEGRHYLQIFVLANFALAGSTLYTLSLAFLPLLVLMVVSVICGLVLLAFHSSDTQMQLDRQQFRLLTRTTLMLPFGALVLMLLFFFILPRTQHAMWDFLNPGPKSFSALSETMRPGGFAANAGDDTVVLRVEMPEVIEAELYWRALVLDELEGETWVRGKHAEQGRPLLEGGREVEQVIYPEAINNLYLVALDTPRQFSGVRTFWRTDGTARASRTSKKPRQYRAISLLGVSFAEKRPQKQDALTRLPDGMAPRAREEADRLVDTAMTRTERITAIEGFFIRRQLTYATDNLPAGGDLVDTFLFDSAKGYCEYFASSFAVMLRQAGVPARLVGGYLGGSFNEFGSYYSVTERMAHVWVEAMLEDGTWLRLDPSRFAINADSALLANRMQKTLGWRQLADAVDYYWTQVVITFDFGRQFGALKGIRDQVRKLRGSRPDLRPWLWPGASGLLLTGLLVVLWRRGKVPVEKRLLDDFLQLVGRRYELGKLPPSVGLNDIARRCGDIRCDRFVRLYGSAIYRDRSLTRNEIDVLRNLLRDMRRNRG